MSNGTNADRIVHLCEAGKILHEVIPVEKQCLEDKLRNSSDFAGVFVVHCEASTGLINPVKEIGDIVKAHNKGKYFFFFGLCVYYSINRLSGGCTKSVLAVENPTRFNK